jgi:amino acid adenylation domain-containing protein/non-ribosomal peptide synthase protein (TIGR01720 family)
MSLLQSKPQLPQQTIPRQTNGGVTPLSFGQQRMWFFQQLDPVSPLYNTYRTWRVRGALNVEALQKAVQTIVARHSVLRAVIQVVDGKPCQVTDDTSAFELPVVDLRGSTFEAAEIVCKEEIQQAAKAPFDLSRGPLFRATLWRLDDEDYVLLVSMHHIITDGWSFGVLYREISVLYQAFESGDSSPLPDLLLQYGDYALWQHDFLQGTRLENLLTYWRGQLADLTPLQLPTERIRTALSSFKGERQGFSLANALTAQLKRLSQQEGVTLFTMLLTCFKVLLFRYADQTDIAVGTMKHNRTRKEVEPLIGMFMNTLVLRSDLSDNPGFRELLQDVRKTCLDAYTHQELPFDRLVDDLHPERELGQNPLFQVAIIYHNTPDQTFRLPDLEIRPFEFSDVGPYQLGNDTSKFDLTLTLVQSDGEIQGMMEYSTDVFNRTSIGRMIGHLQTLIESVVANPEQRIGELSLMGDRERQEIINMGFGPTSKYPKDQCFQEVFAQQVTKNSKAAAVVFEDQSLTYHELNTRANQLAHYLQRHGVGPEVRVGLCLNRSIEMIVAVLGIFKAAGAYVPMDPDYPQERLAFMARDADLRVILTQEKFQKHLSYLGGEHIHLDVDWPVIGQERESNPVSQGSADSLAYVIFTSGSTGRPKGVEVEHRQVLNYVDGILEQLKLPAGASFAMVSPITADLGNTMLYPALAIGGTLHIISDDRATDAVALAAYFKHHQPDCLKIVPSHLASLMMGPTPTEVLPQKRLFVGGEACPWQLVEKVQALKPGCRVINHYGPTETTVGVTTHQVATTDRITRYSPSVPIGRALPNSQLYILDSHQNPVPPGVAGELHIGGRGLARGYAGAPELTAEKFVPHPYSEKPGARLYKTGDRARFQPDGAIEFLGRIDHQVKLRGFRIELGEIETVLNQHKGVQAAAVVVREKEDRQKQLVAYVVPKQGQLSAGDLRQFMNQSLPGYMVPTIFVMLEDLPLTPNGKVDRRALPAPAETRPELEAVFQAPHAGPEQTLASIWKQLLGVDPVGRHDNFFELGGDSILSIQMGARANQAGLRVTPKQIFEHQTIAELAKVTGIYQEVIAEQGVVTGSLPLTPIQHWFFEQQFGQPHHWNMAWVLEAPEPLLPEHMEQVVETLVMHHDALRLRLTQTDKGWQQKLGDPGGPSPFAYFDWSHLSATEAEKAWDLEAGRLQASLSLSDGPLIRVALAHFGSGRPDRVLLVIHHLAVDGVSWRILLEDLQTAYDQLQKGTPIQLPPKTTSLRHWAERLGDYAHSGAIEQEVSYWQEVVNTPCAPIPRDVADGENTVASSQTVVVTLTREETQTLLQKIPEVYHTQINDVLLTALADTLTQWTNQENLLIYLEGHGREELFAGIDLSRTVGWFTSKFPVVLKRGPSDHPGECLKTVKEQLRQIPNRGIGFGVLRYLNRDINLQAKFGDRVHPEVTFNYLGQFDQTMQDPTLFTRSTASLGPTRSPQQNRVNLVEIIGVINAGMLQMQWHYSENIHRRATMEAVANNYIVALRTLIRHCQSPEAGGYTPSDFPLARISQHALDEILTHLLTEGNPPEMADLYPLTPLQQGIWFHELVAPESGTYFRRIVSRLDGELDIDLLKRAWEQVVERHAILRTSLVWEGLEQPLQIVHPTVLLPWDQQDWRDKSTMVEMEEPERLQSFLEEDRARGIDFTQPPLMRLTLIQVAESKALLVWSYHHLILDRWSIEVVQKDVWAAYQALRIGQAVPDERPRPFRAYLEWLPKQDLAEAERYWRRTLEGFKVSTLLGMERESVLGERQTNHYDGQHLTLSEQATSTLERFARQHQLTLNTLVQGAWALVLSRYSETQDVVFGVTSSGRFAELPGMETMVGMLINTLPVRVKLDNRQLVAAWLKEVQTQQAGTRQYEYTPLFEVQKWSEVSAETPLFSTLMVFENTPGNESFATGSGGLSVRQDFVASDLQTNYPLNLACVVDRTLRMLITYDAKRFEAAAIRRILGHVQQVLAEMVAKPEQPLGTISWITEAERFQLLVDWNATATDALSDACFLSLFETQVVQHPETAALVFEDQTLTYAELNMQANQLAHYLRQEQIRPEACVGIYLPRGVDLVVAIIGIWKAGGAYVPLDPAYPTDRIAYMLKDSKVKLLLTHTDMATQLPSHDSPVVCLDTVKSQLKSTTGTNLGLDIIPDSLAYVLYTSGSTGTPKGVLVPHRGLANIGAEQHRHFGVGPQSRVLQFAISSFDASVFELVMALQSGGTLYMGAPDSLLPGDPLMHFLREHAITIATLPPSALAAMAPEPLPALETLTVAGEACSSTIVEQWGVGRAFFNLYGPTESTIWTTVAQCQANSPGRPPIGKPIGNTQVYLLDPGLHPVPIGIPGELYIGGIGLARGYMGRPEVTAEKFVPNPFSSDPGARLYRTGDRARYRANGKLEFLGRIDYQVKLRGYRIELGEIEAVLAQHPNVKEAVALMREDTPDDKRLVAYLVPAENAELPSDLRQFLKQTLPEYMVPAIFVKLEALPLTPNGKVDRRALPEPDESLTGSVKNYVQPRNPMEETLAQIWGDVLRVKQVGVHDNFFALGGHSLLVTRVVSQIQKEFHVDLKIAQFFEMPTISELAEVVEGLLWISAGRPSEAEAESQEREEGRV